MKRGQAALLAVLLVAAVGAFVMLKGASTTGMLHTDTVAKTLEPASATSNYLLCGEECKESYYDCKMDAETKQDFYACSASLSECKNACVDNYLPDGHR